MTQNHGEMGELYPVAGDRFRYWMGELKGLFSFELEDEASHGLPPAVTFSVESHMSGEGLCRTTAGRTHSFAWAWVGAELHLWLDGSLFVFQGSETRRGGSSTGTEASGDLTAPMTGAVLEVLVREGERVERNQTVVLIESMKMELVIAAPYGGVVRRVAVEPGQQVDKGMRLVDVEPEGDAEE